MFVVIYLYLKLKGFLLPFQRYVAHMCRFNSKQIINHFLNGNILTDFCSKSHELSRVKYQKASIEIEAEGTHY